MTVQDAMRKLAELLGHHSGILGQPGPDYLASEDASARLLDAMPDPDLSRGYSDYESATAAREWRCDWAGDGELGFSVYNPDRKTAVFLAALKWQGIERPEELK